MGSGIMGKRVVKVFSVVTSGWEELEKGKAVTNGGEDVHHDFGFTLQFSVLPDKVKKNTVSARNIVYLLKSLGH
jgi:hypothetical protein